MQKPSVKRKVTFIVIAVLIFLGGALFGKNYEAYVNKDAYKLQENIQALESKLQQSALVPPNYSKATPEVLQSILSSSGDKYAHYFEPKEFAKFLEESDGSFGGIGVVLSERNGQAYVVKVYPNTPAARAGLQAGDTFISVNGVKKQWGVSDLANTLRSKPGTSFEIEWESHPDYSAEADMQFPLSLENEKESGVQSSAPVAEGIHKATITTELIDYPNVEHERINDKGLYDKNGSFVLIKVGQFNAKCAQDITEALREVGALTSQNRPEHSSVGPAPVEGIILDLRNNPGGALDQAIAVASLFIDKGAAVHIVGKNNQTVSYPLSGKPVCDKPLIVLVNGDTASSSEIVTSDLQDYKRALVVGTLTYGKGSVQQVQHLLDGAGVKFTIAHYLSGKKHKVDDLGVLPDKIISMPAQYINQGAHDTQRALAAKLLKEVIHKGSYDIDGLSNPAGTQSELVEAQRKRAQEKADALRKRFTELQKQAYIKALREEQSQESASQEHGSR